MNVQRLALDLAGDVRELDINPLVVRPARRGRPGCIGGTQVNPLNPVPDGVNVDEELVAKLENGVLWLTINRADKGNAIPYYVRDRLTQHFWDAHGDLDVRAIVLTAAGERHFCTGADLSVPQPAGKPKPEGAPAMVVGGAIHMMRLGFQRLMEAMLDCEKPIIVALNGTAAGGGAMFVLAADLVIAADNAKLIQVFVRRGLVPDGGVAYLLPRVVGMHKAKELIFFGDDLSAADAAALGIVNKVVPAAELPGGRRRSGPSGSRAARPRRSAGRRSCCTTRRSSRVANLLAGRGDARRAQLVTPVDSRRGRCVVPRAPGTGVEGLVSVQSSSRTRPRSSASARPTFGKGLPDTELSLACQAVSIALDDAGIAPSEVDGIASYTMEPNREVDVARNVGLGDITWFSQVGFGGGAGCGVVGQAAMAVATGQCEVAVAWRARKRAERRRAGRGRRRRRASPTASSGSRPFGMHPARRRDRDAHPPLHARVRRHARPPRQRRARVPQARGAQPRVDDGPQAA